MTRSDVQTLVQIKRDLTYPLICPYHTETQGVQKNKFHIKQVTMAIHKNFVYLVTSFDFIWFTSTVKFILNLKSTYVSKRQLIIW